MGQSSVNYRAHGSGVWNTPQHKADSIQRKVEESRRNRPDLHAFDTLVAIASLRYSDEANSATVESILTSGVLHSEQDSGSSSILRGDERHTSNDAPTYPVTPKLPARSDEELGGVKVGQYLPRRMSLDECAERWSVAAHDGSDSDSDSDSEPIRRGVRETTAAAAIRRDLPSITHHELPPEAFREGDEVLVYTARVDGCARWRGATIARTPSLECDWDNAPGIYFYRCMVTMNDTGRMMGPFRTALNEILPRRGLLPAALERQRSTSM
ncbi:hypothetical protein C2E23DRAFT_551523 [Lenzites betulinus]|nr:hypothetical protein C2E23DRAFT_551523 [Lenzites betulinus]